MGENVTYWHFLFAAFSCTVRWSICTWFPYVDSGASCALPSFFFQMGFADLTPCCAGRPVVFNTINFTVYIWLTIWIQWGVDTHESTRGWVHFLYTVYDFTIFFLHILVCYLYQNNNDSLLLRCFLQRERIFILIRLISVKCRCVCSEKKKLLISEITLIVCPKIILSSLLCFGFPSWEITDIHKNIF